MPREVFAMAGVSFCVALGFGVVAPAIPLFAKEFGVDAFLAGAVVSAFALMRFVSGLGAGWLVDRIGERTGLALGIVVVAVSSLLAGLSANYPQLLILRGVGGVGSAVFGVAAVSLVIRVAVQRLRARAMSIYRYGFLLGGIVGPAVGGGVLGISYRAPFFLYAGTLGLAAAVALVFLSGRKSEPEPEPEQTEAAEPAETADPHPEPTFADVVRTKQYQAALVGNLAVGVNRGIRNTVVSLLIVNGIGAASGWAGAAFAVAALTQTALMFPAARWADTSGRRPALVTGAVVTGLALVLLGVSGVLAVALVAMALFGAGAGVFGSVPGALVGDVVGKRSGKVVAVFNMTSDLGGFTAPLVAGWLVDQGSYLGAFGFGAAVVAIAGVFAFRLPAAPSPGSSG